MYEISVCIARWQISFHLSQTIQFIRYREFIVLFLNLSQPNVLSMPNNGSFYFKRVYSIRFGNLVKPLNITRCHILFDTLFILFVQQVLHLTQISEGIHHILITSPMDNLVYRCIKWIIKSPIKHVYSSPYWTYRYITIEHQIAKKRRKKRREKKEET